MRTGERSATPRSRGVAPRAAVLLQRKLMTPERARRSPRTRRDGSGQRIRENRREMWSGRLADAVPWLRSSAARRAPWTDHLQLQASIATSQGCAVPLPSDSVARHSLHSAPIADRSSSCPQDRRGELHFAIGLLRAGCRARPGPRCGPRIRDGTTMSQTARICGSTLCAHSLLQSHPAPSTVYWLSRAIQP